MLFIYYAHNDVTYSLRSVGVSCGQPEDPSNGRVDSSAGTSFGDVAKYSCDRGYTLNGPTFRACQVNRQWSQNMPTCESEKILCSAAEFSNHLCCCITMLLHVIM